MPRLEWDKGIEKIYPMSLDSGVLYTGDPYTVRGGVPWNGLVSVDIETVFDDAEPLYLDGIRIGNHMISRRGEVKATIQAFTYPPEFEVFQGVVSKTNGVSIHENPIKPFGLSWRTRKANGVDPLGTEIIHFLGRAIATPTKQSFKTLSADPSLTLFSWDISTIPISTGEEYPISYWTVDCSKISYGLKMALLEGAWGIPGSTTSTSYPKIMTPTEIASLVDNSFAPVAPTRLNDYQVTLPTVTPVGGYSYRLTQKGTAIETVQSGPYTINDSKVVIQAIPKPGKYIRPDAVSKWTFANLRAPVIPVAPTRLGSGSVRLTSASPMGAFTWRYERDGVLVTTSASGTVTFSSSYNENKFTAVIGTGYYFGRGAQTSWTFNYQYVFPRTPRKTSATKITLPERSPAGSYKYALYINGGLVSTDMSGVLDISGVSLGVPIKIVANAISPWVLDPTAVKEWTFYRG